MYVSVKQIHKKNQHFQTRTHTTTHTPSGSTISPLYKVLNSLVCYPDSRGRQLAVTHIVYEASQLFLLLFTFHCVAFYLFIFILKRASM